tara:strand:+ start:568 stop:1035 length:468 start_codon:yes stop_codon:yes gene_type:complete
MIFSQFMLILIPCLLQVEELICGQGDVDIAVLRRHTEYDDNIDPHSAYIKNFWRVLEEMSLQERKRFLKFVSSRSRLPASPQDWVMPFKIILPQMRMREKPDEAFPYAQTCFFTLSLPEYSTYEIMKSALLKASECVEMDADEAVNDNVYWSDNR